MVLAWKDCPPSKHLTDNATDCPDVKRSAVLLWQQHHLASGRTEEGLETFARRLLKKNGGTRIGTERNTCCFQNV
eukprot:3080040-Amphidinium_carterae.1